MQSYTTIGRLTKDPVLTYTDKAKCTFTLAVEEKKKGFQRVDWIPCIAWRELAEVIANHTHKGKLVAIEGKLRSITYQDEQGNNRFRLEVEVREISFF